MRLERNALESQHAIPGETDILRLLPCKLAGDLNVADRDGGLRLNDQFHQGPHSSAANVHLGFGVGALRAHVGSTLLLVAICRRGQHPELHKIHIIHDVKHNLHPVELVALRVLGVGQPHPHEDQPVLRRVLHAGVNSRTPQRGAVGDAAVGLDGKAPVGGDPPVDVQLTQGEVRLPCVCLLNNDHVGCLGSAHALDVVHSPRLHRHGGTLPPRRRIRHRLVVIPRVHQHLNILTHGQPHPRRGILPVQVDDHVVSGCRQAGPLVAVGHDGDLRRGKRHVPHFVRAAYWGEGLAAQAAGEAKIVS
mmetsp:Transcript_38933/g.84938  ORF Transcript_38933/g.84938 Transcript_38933/m.84938 type:complete len:305 (-) Transcript_38933:952-1866(-)